MVCFIFCWLFWTSLSWRIASSRPIRSPDFMVSVQRCCHGSPKGPSCLTSFRFRSTTKSTGDSGLLDSESSKYLGPLWISGEITLFHEFGRWGLEPLGEWPAAKPSGQLLRPYAPCDPGGVVVTNPYRKHRHISHWWFTLQGGAP